MPAWEPVDPQNLGWSTYAGGNDYDEFMGCDKDLENNVYACGYTMGLNFPVESGYQLFEANDDEFAGFQDAVVMKFEGATKRILWATYLGGTSTPNRWEQATDIAVYNGANPNKQYAFVTGSAQSPNFPILIESGYGFDLAENEPNSPLGKRLFISAFTKYDGRLHWSTTHGAPGNQTWQEDGTCISVDDDGIVAVGGRLEASGNGTFPYVTPGGAYTQAWGGGLVMVFDQSYQIAYCTPFGSTGDQCRVNDVKLVKYGSPATRRLFITGTTAEPNGTNYPLPVLQNGGLFYQPTYGGGAMDA